MSFWMPKVGDRVQWRNLLGTISDTYWAHRDRFTVQFDDGSESDFGCESLRYIPPQEPRP
ncbi:hypothetical protein [Sphingomonas sp. 1P08PE]|uniref:hypothetical protein n=1 Tax=Sphingomonas sp. 1P08PE TaxID=554122 RepID=UPI0039A1CA63